MFANVQKVHSAAFAAVAAFAVSLACISAAVGPVLPVA